MTTDLSKYDATQLPSADVLGRQRYAIVVFTLLHIEEVLHLPSDEPRDLGEGKRHHQEAEDEEAGNQTVVAHGLWDGVSSHPIASTSQLRMIERVVGRGPRCSLPSSSQYPRSRQWHQRRDRSC